MSSFQTAQGHAFCKLFHAAGPHANPPSHIILTLGRPVMFRGPSFIVSTMQEETTPIFKRLWYDWTQQQPGIEPTNPLGQCWVPPIVAFYDQQGLLRTYSLPGGSIRSTHPGSPRGYRDETIEVVSSYNYLEVLFNYDGKFGRSIKKQISQAKRALFALLSKARKLQLPLDLICHLVDACISPLLLYGCEVWGYSNLEAVERVHS